MNIFEHIIVMIFQDIGENGFNLIHVKLFRMDPTQSGLIFQTKYDCDSDYDRMWLGLDHGHVQHSK